MKKSALSCAMVLTLCACSNDFSFAEGGATEYELDSATSGLQVSVKNDIPEIQGKNDRFKVHLNVAFCSAIVETKAETRAARNAEINAETDRVPPSTCVRLTGVIAPGGVQNFLVSKSDLAKVLRDGHGQGHFMFQDDHQQVFGYWPCYRPNDRLSLDRNVDKKQIWRVTVNQRHTWWYGCLVDRVE